jgi:hypothetical protein
MQLEKFEGIGKSESEEKWPVWIWLTFWGWQIFGEIIKITARDNGIVSGYVEILNL